MSNFKAALSVMALGLSLSACDTWVSDGSLNANFNATLVQQSNNNELHLNAGESVPAKIEFSSGSKKLTLTVGDEKIVFKNAVVVENSETTSTVSSAFDQSGVSTMDGQQAGLSVSQKLICDPNCETVREWRETRSCNRNISHGRGHRVITGIEVVAVREVTRRFDVQSDLVAERYGQLGAVHGTNTQTRRTERVVSICN
jgi:hypothetical protein